MLRDQDQIPNYRVDSLKWETGIHGSGRPKFPSPTEGSQDSLKRIGGVCWCGDAAEVLSGVGTPPEARVGSCMPPWEGVHSLLPCTYNLLSTPISAAIAYAGQAMSARYVPSSPIMT